MRDLRDDYCEFVLSNTDPSVANALRRIMLVEVTCTLCSLLHFRSPASTYFYMPLQALCPVQCCDIVRGLLGIGVHGHRMHAPGCRMCTMDPQSHVGMRSANAQGLQQCGSLGGPHLVLHDGEGGSPDRPILGVLCFLGHSVGCATAERMLLLRGQCPSTHHCYGPGIR